MKKGVLLLILLLLVTLASSTLLAAGPVSIDTDGDGIEDNQDADDDGDGVVDSQDPWPLDKRYSKDTDLDGLPDAWETSNSLNPNDVIDANSDTDEDGLSAIEEFAAGTFANRSDSDQDTLPDGWEIDNSRNPLAADYQIGAGFNHSCALDDAGVQCWGWNDDGQTNVPALLNPVQVSAGGFHTCALDDTGVQCWGRNEEGQTTVPDLLFDFDRYFDSDLDGVEDNGDAFPLDAEEQVDSDGDGVGDNGDAFPLDPNRQ